jgi:hypothetical protein
MKAATQWIPQELFERNVKMRPPPDFEYQKKPRLHFPVADLKKQVQRIKR